VKQLSSEELQLQLQKDKNDRLQKCKVEMEEILKKYRCEIIALPQLAIRESVVVAVAEVQIKLLP